MNNETKKIFVANGILHGHFTTSVEIVRELNALGYDITCYVTDEFAERLNVPVKKVVYSTDVSEIAKKLPPTFPPFAINAFKVGKATDEIITLLSKDETDYDYYIFDAFFDITEMNRVLKLDPSKFSVIYPSFILTDENQFNNDRTLGLQITNKKYNINLHDFVGLIFTPNPYKKLVPVSRFFHLRAEDTDETCYFIGPNIEKRDIDQSFTFKKDEGKKLLYISLGTIFGKDLGFYYNCIEAFRNSEEYQVIMSVGRWVDINENFKDIPENFTILNYVPQTQLLPDVDVFITHAGYNSTTEGIRAGVSLVLVPQDVDQFDVAKAVENLNAGLYLNKREQDLTADVIRNAVDKAYENRDTFRQNMKTIEDSFEEARQNRKAIFKEIFA